MNEDAAAPAKTITIPAPASYPALYVATSATAGVWLAQTGPPGVQGPQGIQGVPGTPAPNTWG